MFVKYNELVCVKVYFLNTQKKERKRVGIYICYQATLPEQKGAPLELPFPC